MKLLARIWNKSESSLSFS